MGVREGRFITIYVLGKRYEVPEGLTIQKAMEYSGYRLIHGCGCRGGVCGACLTEYRTSKDYRLKVVLACQSLVEPEMQIAQSSFIPMNRASYELEALGKQSSILGKIYPEIYRCLQCHTCTRICPMEIEVMDYIAAAMKNDIEKVATLSFPCIMCGACASKCPAEISQPNVALLARRLYGRYVLSLPKRLDERINEIENGRYHEMLKRLTQISKEELIEIYIKREQEPQDDLEWGPKDPNFPGDLLGVKGKISIGE